MGAKYPKTVAKIVDDADVQLEFFQYPADYWVHLRTTKLIESAFATVRLELSQGDKGARIVRCRTGDGLQPLI